MSTRIVLQHCLPHLLCSQHILATLPHVLLFSSLSCAWRTCLAALWASLVVLPAHSCSIAWCALMYKSCGFACRRFLQHSLLYSCVQASCGLCTRLQHCLPLFGALMHILAASLVERLRTDAETQPAPRGGAKEQKKFVKKKIPALWA